tara:strand:+ start:1520 stop:1855 length:336 start_codon:yes stop_codon:yes gene_type:complete
MELRRLKALHPTISARRLCDLLGLNRSTVWRCETGYTSKVVQLEKVKQEKEFTQRIKALAHQNPSWGYRRVWAWFKYRDKQLINQKKVRCIIRNNRWQARKHRAQYSHKMA